MSLYEWLLFLHMLAAFLLVAGLTAYGVLVLGGDAARRALAPPALALWNAGGIGVLVFGIWLALNVDGYELWDGWIVAAIVLWLVASGVGDRLGRELRDGSAPPDSGRARLLLAVMSVATLALLADMIFKPGHDVRDRPPGRLEPAAVRPRGGGDAAGRSARRRAGALGERAAPRRRRGGAAAPGAARAAARRAAGLPGHAHGRGWVASEEATGDPAWVGIGYGTADGGLLLAIIAAVLAWRATRRGAAGPGGLGRAVVVLSALLLVAYAVAIWAMTAKPS